MCVACGTPPKAGDKFCYNCKAETTPDAVICMKCGVSLGNKSLNLMQSSNTKTSNIDASQIESKRTTTGILALLLGTLGVHKFYLGYNKAGIIHIILLIVVLPLGTLFTCGFGIFALVPLIAIIPLVEGIKYLIISDAEFIKTYQINKKEWF
jgi:TM2 domain-containing membrane protein YozV